MPSGGAVPSEALKEKKIGAPAAPHSLKILPQGHEDFEYMLSFEIGQRESGLYSERTDRQTESQNHQTIQHRIII